MPDKTMTVTDEMVDAAREALIRARGTDPRVWMRAAIAAALDAAPTTDEDNTSNAAFMAESERDYWQERAEKAERERDEARESLREANETVKSLRAMTAREHLDAAREVGHPLPGGGTIPEGAVFWVRDGEGPWEFVGEGPRDDFDTSPFPNARYVLLDPPTPKRPKWADLGEALDRLWPHGTDGIAREDIARRLHTEAGVRVVSEDGAS